MVNNTIYKVFKILPPQTKEKDRRKLQQIENKTKQKLISDQNNMLGFVLLQYI